MIGNDSDNNGEVEITLIVFNELPLELRKIENYKEFEKQLEGHYE